MIERASTVGVLIQLPGLPLEKLRTNLINMVVKSHLYWGKELYLPTIL